MNTLFFVHTPFQLFVSQQIIFQEKYDNVIFLLGTVGDNYAFYETFDLMLQDAPFQYVVYKIDGLSHWASLSRKRLLFDMYETYIREKKIRNILKKGNVDMIYMGDMNNLSCKFGALLYAQLGFKIGFYEEGTSHYYWAQYSDNFPFVNSILAKLTDYFFYRPIWHLDFGKYMFFKAQLSFSDLPINKRYSILPKYNDSFDFQLYLHNVENQALAEYIMADISGYDKSCNVTLFLSEPIFEVGIGNEEICLSVIDDYLKSDAETDLFLLKYHPREKEIMKKKIEGLFIRNRKKYRIISSSLTLPIELYLLYLLPKNVVLFLTSTFMYLKYLSPQTRVKMLVYDYALLCSQRGYDVSSFKQKMKELGL